MPAASGCCHPVPCVAPRSASDCGATSRVVAHDCWFCTGSVDYKGYGQINDGKGRIRKAHQVVLEVVLGRPLERGDGLHRCDILALL